MIVARLAPLVSLAGSAGAVTHAHPGGPAAPRREVRVAAREPISPDKAIIVWVALGLLCWAFLLALGWLVYGAAR